MKTAYDLLIAGGGLVGGALALALEPLGLRIGLIEPISETDRERAPQGDRALALSRQSVQTLKSLGLLTAEEDDASAIRRIHVSDRGHFGKVHLEAADCGVDRLGQVVRARRLEKDLSDRLREQASLEVFCPARILSLASSREEVLVSLRDDQGDRVLSAPLLVAADGAQSSVRGLLGIQQDQRDYEQTALVTEVTVGQDPQGTAFERFTPDGPLALLPLGPKRCSVVWTLAKTRAEQVLLENEAQQTQTLQEAFGHWLGPLRLAQGLTAFPLRLIQAKTMVEGRVVLIGNAMHTLHPVAGQGFNLGLRDAMVLADHLATHRQLKGDLGDPAFLGRYARSREKDLKTVVRFTDGLVQLFSIDRGPLVAGRTLALMTLDRLPFIKRRLMGRAMGYGQGA